MRVFISSTVFDLIDARAEIAELLRGMGIAPLLSDDKLSEFKVEHAKNSIETCLINVESADEIVVVLDKRYGHKIGVYGFDDISATHLEYRHAIKHKKPVHFFVRDRLAADYATWKKNKRSNSIDLPWVAKSEYGLFDLLEEHGKPVQKTSSTNWYNHFSSSVDLKAAISKRFEKRILQQRLVEAIGENRFPLFEIETEVEPTIIDNCEALMCRCRLKNVGGSPAFDYKVRWETSTKLDKRKSESGEILAPGSAIRMSYIYGMGGSDIETSRILLLTYNSVLGVAVDEKYEVSYSVRPGPQRLMRSGASRISQQLRRASIPEIAIADL